MKAEICQTFTAAAPRCGALKNKGVSVSDKKERQRGYSKAHYEKRREAGDVRAIVWLNAEAADALDLAVKAIGKSKEAAVNQAIIEMAARLRQ